MEVFGMANIWRVYEGREPTVGEPWVRLSLDVVVAAFDLSPADFISDLEHTPRFGDEKRDLRHLGFRHVVVEVEDGEAQQTNLIPGFYEARVRPGDAPGRLLRQALAAELGAENIVRVELYPTTDFEGREALRVAVVISPRATPRLKARVLDALVAVRERLRDMGDDRTPIVEYATEAELADGDAQP
jgi:hypothetical protein